MKNDKNTRIITTESPNFSTLLTRNSSKKKIKLYSNNKYRNKSSNFFKLDINNLPNINTKDNNQIFENKKEKENNNFKNSFASTFYSTNSCKQINLPKAETLLNIKQLNILKKNSFSKSKKKLEIKPYLFGFTKDKKNKKNENCDLNIDNTNTNEHINEKESDYSLIIKKLDRWDKDNCFVKQYDKISLYTILNKYYKKKGLHQDLKNLNTMDNLLKSKNNYDKIMQNRLNYKSNKIITEYFNSPKKGRNKIKLNIRYSNKINNYNENKSPKKQENDNDDNKLLYEKVKYETQLHNDLVFVNNIIYNKKCLKKEKLKKLEEIYKNKTDLKKEYDNKYNYHVKDYWLKYDEYDLRYKQLEVLILQQNKKEKLEKKETKEIKENKDEKNNKINDNKNKEKVSNDNDKVKINNDKYENENTIKNEEMHKIEDSKEENNNNTIKRNNVKRATNNDTFYFIKEMNFIKNTKLNTINLELKKNIANLDSEYKQKLTEVNKQKKDMEEQIQIINNELNYYKQVNEELIREHRTYYMNLLRKGTDYRKEGLVWVVKNLLELQIHLEYQHFPKFLTHEHIDYLIKLAHLLLEQNELIIIIKVLKKRQTTIYMDENIQAYNMLDKFMEKHLKEKKINQNNFLIGNLHHNIDMNYGKKMVNIIHEIDKKFYKVYQNNKEIMKNYLEKNEEEVKLRNAMEHIKKGLYNSDNFVKDNQVSILDAFMCNTKNKDFFSFILKIKNRLNQLSKIIDNLIKNEKDFYLEQIKKINNTSTNNYDNNYYNKDIIKKSLFGEKCDF